MNDPTNEFSSISNPSDTPLPTGLMMALAQNMHAMQDFAQLSDAGRQQLIDKATSTHSREEMQLLVRNIHQFL